MHKVAALVLATLVGISALGFAKPAEARVYVGVGIGLPIPAVVAYPGVYAPYYGYYGPRYYRPGFCTLRLRLRLSGLRLLARALALNAALVAALLLRGGGARRGARRRFRIGRILAGIDQGLVVRDLAVGH